MSVLEEQGDWQLVQLTASGNGGAFEILIVRYDRLVRFVALRRGAHLLPHNDIDELVNETWYQALRRVLSQDFDPAVRFSAWLTGLCLNVLKLRAFRPVGASLRGGSGQGREFLADPPDDSETPAAAAARAELLLALRQCLARRNPRERMLYELVYVGGQTKVGAARELGCSEAYVRQKLLPRLHEALARCLARRGFRDGTMENLA